MKLKKILLTLDDNLYIGIIDNYISTEAIKIFEYIIKNCKLDKTGHLISKKFKITKENAIDLSLCNKKGDFYRTRGSDTLKEVLGIFLLIKENDSSMLIRFISSFIYSERDDESIILEFEGAIEQYLSRVIEYLNKKQ